jgi:hypothetical protein
MEAAVLDPETSVLCVLDHTGDTRMQWNRKNLSEVNAARARFAELKGKGYMAYRVNRADTQGEVLDEFDPTAERIILHAAMVGG